MRRIPVLVGSVLLSLALAAGGFLLDARHTEEPGPPGLADGEIAPGILVDGDPIPKGTDLEGFVGAKAETILQQKLELYYAGEALGSFDLRALGASVDTETAIETVRSIGHVGEKAERRQDIHEAEQGEVDVHLRVVIDADRLAELLVPSKETLDRAPMPARRKIDRAAKSDTVIEHEDGLYVDVFAAAEAVLVAVERKRPSVELTPFSWRPVATREAVAKANVDVVMSSFETRYGGAPGRNKNVARAAGLLDGLVLMPGETVSFNETVGPRTVENGFFSAPEIYKGEMREGIGGGSCQVASTLYAAAYFGGFEVLQRRNHSRPSGYIRTGMDATVSYPVLDLRIRNPYDFPVVLSSRADGLTLRFELLGKEKRVDVALETETLAVLKYSRKIEKTAYIPAGEYRVKQKGRTGVSIKKIKTTKDLRSGNSMLEESTDIYPPTQEIFIVGPGFDEADLPPLEPKTAPASGEAGEVPLGNSGGGV